MSDMVLLCEKTSFSDSILSGYIQNIKPEQFGHYIKVASLRNFQHLLCELLNDTNTKCKLIGHDACW